MILTRTVLLFLLFTSVAFGVSYAPSEDLGPHRVQRENFPGIVEGQYLTAPLEGQRKSLRVRTAGDNESGVSIRGLRHYKGAEPEEYKLHRSVLGFGERGSDPFYQVESLYGEKRRHVGELAGTLNEYEVGLRIEVREPISTGEGILAFGIGIPREGRASDSRSVTKLRFRFDPSKLEGENDPITALALRPELFEVYGRYEVEVNGEPRRKRVTRDGMPLPELLMSLGFPRNSIPLGDPSWQPGGSGGGAASPEVEPGA